MITDRRTSLDPMKPNSLLSPAERRERKTIKKQIKQAKAMRKKQFAIENEKNLEKERLARVVLAQNGAVFQKKPSKKLKNRAKMYARKLAHLQNTNQKPSSDDISISSKSPLLSLRERAYDEVSELCNQLLHYKTYRSAPIEAREAGYQLLKHMAKGTQRLDMMVTTDTSKTTTTEVEQAIWGYVKYKFAKRSMLTFNALQQLQPSVNGLIRGGNCPISLVPKDFLWSQLSTIETIVSVGGGPGNNLYGCALFRRLHRLHTTSKNDDSLSVKSKDQLLWPTLKNLIVLDFAEQSWSKVVEYVAHLSKKYEHSEETLYSCHHCDVTLPLLHESNSDAVLPLKTCGLIIVSYLLTETKGKWHQFMLETWQIALPGTIFLFFEPTVWQHHILLKLLGVVITNEENKKESVVDMDGIQEENTKRKFAPMEQVYYWWLDQIEEEVAVMHPIDLNTTLHRDGPGILLLRKPGGK